MTKSLITHKAESAVRRVTYFNLTQGGFGPQNSMNKSKLDSYEVINSFRDPNQPYRC